MPNVYKVLGQAVSASASLDITNKEVSNNIVTLTSASAHNIVVGQPVTVSEAAQSNTISNKALTSNVATLTTSSAHRIQVGQSVTVENVDATFNGTHTVTAISASANTFSFAKTASNVTSTSATGTVSYLDPVFNGTFIVDSDPTLTTFTYEFPSEDLSSTSASVTGSHIPWQVVYTCPANTAAVVSSTAICNQNVRPTSYQLAISDSTSVEQKDIVFYNDIIEESDTVVATAGITVDATNKYIMFAADVDAVSINIFGMEIS